REWAWKKKPSPRSKPGSCAPATAGTGNLSVAQLPSKLFSAYCNFLSAKTSARFSIRQPILRDGLLTTRLRLASKDFGLLRRRVWRRVHARSIFPAVHLLAA